MFFVKNPLHPTVSRYFDDDWSTLFNWSNRNFSPRNTNVPATNIIESENEFIIEMAVPGMQKDDFQIQLSNNMLTVKSKHENQSSEKDETSYVLREFSPYSFERSFTLNQRVVDDANIKATCENGILKLLLPKQDEAKEKPPRTITIS